MKKIIFAILFYSVLNLSAGIKVTAVNSIQSSQGNQQVNSVMYIDKNFLRLEEFSGETKITIIFDKTKKILYMINQASKGYIELTESDLIAQSKKQNEKIKEFEAKIDQMPKEQQAYYKDLLKKQKESLNPKNFKLTYKQGKKTSKIEKWDCISYKAYKDKELVKELWTVDYSAFGAVSTDFEIVKEFAKFNQNALGNSQKQMGIMGDIDLKKEYNGYPIKQVVYIQGKQIGQSLVKNIEVIKFDESLFKIPSDYKKQSIPKSK